MEIPAIEIEGDVHARLSALESYYLRVVQHGATKPVETHGPLLADLQAIISRIQDTRFHFNHLLIRHTDAINRALAGEDATVTLSYQEALLVDTIRDMHARIWQIRRDRIARNTGKTVDEHAALQQA